MINPINPYAAFPLFDADYKEINTIPLLCPTTVFPPICFKVAATGLSPTWKIKDLTDNSLTTIGAVLLTTVELADGNSYVIYEGGVHGLTLVDGRRYQIQITADNTVYYSHSFIPCAVFDLISDSTVVITDTDEGIGPDEWSMDLAFNDTSGPGKRLLYYRASSSDLWISLGGSSGIVTSDNIPGTGTVTFEVRGIIHHGSVTIEKIYTASILTSNPLGTFSITLKSDESRGLDNFLYLEWENSTDIKAYNLYYQGSFKNRFYFEGHRGFATPIDETNFNQNGENELLFDSSGMSQQIPLEVAKVSEFLPLAFTGAKIHDTVKVIRAVDGQSETIRQFTLNYTPDFENNIIPKGTFTYERDYAFVSGCLENETTV